MLNFKQAKQAISACVDAKITVLLVGPPGVAKTACIREVARDFKLPCHELLASNCDVTDIGGMPYIVDGEFRRALLPQIQACVDKPGILFLDEITTCSASVRAPLMRLMLEGYAGGQQLHKDSVVVAAANRPEECPGGIELDAATVNRVVRLDDFQPDIDEIMGYFTNAQKSGTRVFDEFVDFAGTLSVNSDLLDMSPPKASIDGGLPFGSPRAWDRGLQAYAHYCDKAGVGYNNSKEEDSIGYSILAGAVGEHKAITFFGIRKQRKSLPSVEEIATNPASAKVPEGKDKQIAAVGLLARVAEKDSYAAWIYADRLTPEIGAACARMLVMRKDTTKTLFFTEGKKAQIRMLAKTNKGMTK
jgi:hypothetical protein